MRSNGQVLLRRLLKTWHFSQNQSIQESLIAFLKASARRILQDAIETQILIANQKRQQVEIQKTLALRESSAISNVTALHSATGGINRLIGAASGGGTAIGIAALLFPNEFRNLFSEIGNSLSEGSEIIKQAGPNIGTLRFDDGTARKVTSRSTQSGYGRKHFRG